MKVVSIVYPYGQDEDWEKYGQIEIFRINALQQNLEAGIFHGENKILAGREMAKKCLIYGSGALKRGKTEEGEYYLRLAFYPLFMSLKKARSNGI